jgi:hypothetical protein
MKNSQKGFVVPLLITITVLSLLGIGGWTYVANQKIESESKINVFQESSTTTEKNSISEVVVKEKTNQNPIGEGLMWSNLYPVDDFINEYKGLLTPSLIADIKKITNYNSYGSSTDLYVVNGKNQPSFVYLSPWVGDSIIFKIDFGGSRTLDKYMDLNNYPEKLDLKKFDYKFMGLEGNRLILSQERFGNSPGPCYSDWVAAYESRINKGYPGADIIYINSNTGKIDPYNISLEKYKEEKSGQDKCVEDQKACFKSGECY